MAKTDRKRPVTIAVLGFEDCSAWVTAGFLELFDIANVAQNAIRKPRRVSFECDVVAGIGRTVKGSHGVRFSVVPVRKRYDALVVPPLWCESLLDLERRTARLAKQSDSLRRLAARCAIVTSACSGAVLLAQAGLLDGRRATTCWWAVNWFSSRFPQVNLAADQLLVRDGARWTAAAGSAYVNLGLELVREFAGSSVAAATSRLMLIERRRGSQSPFLRPPETTLPSEDTDVERARRYFDAHAYGVLTIEQASHALAMSERTLNRKFKRALGVSPLAYLQSRRIALARQLLETSRSSFEAIVTQCGYEDAASFRKLFARHVGMTPGEYRARFGAV